MFASKILFLWPRITGPIKQLCNLNQKLLEILLKQEILLKKEVLLEQEVLPEQEVLLEQGLRGSCRSPCS